MVINWLKILRKELQKYPLVYIILGFVLGLAFFVRVYRTDQILGFYFDQGRDALVIWDFWHKGKLFLVGPTTGIAGIFRGPFYYYLIAPFYLLGGGDPVWPAVFLAYLSTLAILVLFFLDTKIQDRVTGLLVAVIASFSFYLVLASRWLSNPTPMLILSVLLVWMMYLVTQGTKIAWLAISLILGLSLFHFGSSGEFFYFPAILIFALWQRRTITKPVFFCSLFIIFLTVFPLIVFDIRHDGILRNNIKSFLFQEESFRVSFAEVLNQRLNFYYDVFASKIFAGIGKQEKGIIVVWFIAFIYFLPSLIKKTGVKIIILLLISPMIGLLFFQGNFGNIYDYYLTGYYLVFILLFAIVLGKMWKYKLGKILIVFFFYLFYNANVPVLMSKIKDKVDRPTTIAFGNQKQAVDWIYQDSKGTEFSVDVYVPPVIPYAYDYLFLWYGSKNYGYIPSKDKINPLYTLYEVDPPHQDRLDPWLVRQNKIGRIEKEERFGGITVQKRLRI